MKRENGVTMVSLVVTIIILIILAGVSINMTLGDNGLITIAKKAKENMELAQIAEQTKLNELYTQIGKEEGNWGDTNLDFLERLNDFKRKIAEYIEEAGGIKPEYTANVETFGEHILGIVKEVTKDATATPRDITLGKTAYVNGEKITGTMPALEEQTQATATEEDILNGKTAWVNGSKVTGSMVNQGAVNQTLSAGNTYTIPKGYHDGNGKITAQSLASQTQATATPDKILKDYTAYVNGQYIIGTMSNHGAVNVTLRAGQEYTILPGYHNGAGKVRATDLASQTPATATVDDITVGKTAWVNGSQIIGTRSNTERLYLYNEGNECEDITGGWVASEKSTNYMICKGVNASHTNNTINVEFSKFEYFCVEASSTGTLGGMIRLGVKNKYLDNSDFQKDGRVFISLYPMSLGFANNTGATVIQKCSLKNLDFNLNYYVCVQGDTSYSKGLKVHKIWLE